MTRHTVLAVVLSLALVLTPALVHANEGGAGGGDPFATTPQRAATALTVILMTNVFNNAANTMTLLNFPAIAESQYLTRLLPNSPDMVSTANRLFAVDRIAFAFTAVLMVAMIRGARWRKAMFIPPEAARAYSTGVAMMAVAMVAIMALPFAMMTSYGRHGLASTQ